ncbi:hypothetical protein LIER_12866 [Lithospermum erythrorhizon]|uniref:Uncharacterized protein n=1 Tax=Lithospermum erythrorhizon TaxID=34254 RepID=A0AAV3PXU7_LITER
MPLWRGLRHQMGGGKTRPQARSGVGVSVPKVKLHSVLGLSSIDHRLMDNSKSNHRKTPFSLVYGSDALMFVEI